MNILKKKIVVKHTFRGVHQWKNCPIENVDFLRHPHHHEFTLTVSLPVTDSDRELEFITVQLILDGLIRSLFVNYNTMINSKLIEQKLNLIGIRHDTALPYTADLSGYSCEQICQLVIDNLLKIFPQINNLTVELSEDGHYSGLLEYDRGLSYE